MWDLIVSVPDHCLSFYFDSRLRYMAGGGFLYTVDEQSRIRSRYNRIPHPAPDTKRDKNTNY